MFRKRKPAKQLSADELKSKLFAHFDKTGSLNQMKTEIRGKLVTELFKMRSPLDPSGAQSSNGFEKTLLPLQVCNWLVYDHLLRQGYQYALSTFVAEASVSHPEQLLTASDILGLFGLDSTSSEYKSISRMYSVNNEQDFLNSLLLAVVKSLLDFNSKEEHQNKDVRSGSVDGDNPLFDRVNASENFKFAEKSFVTYKSTDTSFEEQLQVLKEEKEKEIQALRQKWLQELDRLHSQERTMREEVDLKKREIQRQLDEVFAEEEKLKEKEYFMIKEHENKLEKKTRELESEYLSKIHSVENELKISQGKLYDKELRIAQLEADNATLQTNYQSLKRELEEIKQTYKATKEKYSSLLDENTKLLRKFESMSDYSILKGDLEARSNEVSALQRELEELKMSSGKEREGALEKIKNLEAKLKHKETLLAESQRQLSNCRETINREEAIWHRERRKLESDYLESKEMYKNLIKRIENQSDDIQALHQTIHILHYQLTYSDKRIEPKSNSLSKKTGVIPPVINRMEPGIFRINNSSKDTSTYTKDSLKFIEEAKGRIKNLEKEANALRDKYSCVFSTVPSLENIQDKNAISPLIYNITNIPTKSHSNLDYNFETLIRNEIPTLDPCLQMSRKTFTGSDQVFEKDAKVHSAADNLKYSEMRRDMTPSFSGLSSLNIQQQNFASENSKDIADSSAIENVRALSLNADESKTSSFKQHSDDGSPALVKMKLGLESNEGRSSVENELSNPSTALQYQTVEKNMSDSMLGNPSKPSDMPGIGSNSNSSSNVHSKYQFDSGKQAEKISHLKSSITNSKGDGLDIGLPLKENSSLKQYNSKYHDSDLSLKDDSGSKFDPSGDICSIFNSAASPKPEEVHLDSAWKKQSSKDTLKSVPPVVDLDSAWKRKLSLKDNSENQSVPSFFSTMDSVWRRKSIMSPIHSKASSLSSTPKKTAERKYSSEKEEGSGMIQEKEKDSLFSSAIDNSRNSLEYIEHSHPNPTETKKNEISVSSRNDPAQSSDSNNACSLSIRDTESELKTEISSTHGVQPDVSNPNLTERSIEDDSQKNLIEEKLAIPDEHALEVLSSEASDVHLSCGSEQEQPKEDSDNW